MMNEGKEVGRSADFNGLYSRYVASIRPDPHLESLSALCGFVSGARLFVLELYHILCSLSFAF